MATLLYANDLAGAKAWGEQQRGAWVTDRVGVMWLAPKRMRPWQTAVHEALDQPIGYRERHRTRVCDQELWQSGLAVGSGAVEGACKPVRHSRF